MQRRDALHNVLFGEFSSGNEDGRMNAERTARGPLESSTLIRVVKTTCRKPRLSEYGLRARLTSVGDGVPQGVEYRSPVGAAPLQDRGLGLLRDAPTHHRRQYQAHCLRVPGIPRSLRARGKASLCRRHRPYRGPAGRQEIGRLSSIPSHAEPLHIFERRAPQIPEKQVMRRGGALVPAHSRHHQRLRGVGFKWN